MIGTDRRVPRLSDDEWETCRADERCTGLARVETGACLHHADEQAVTAALEAMYLQRHYDLRGTTLSGETVRRILAEPYRAHSKKVVDPHGMDLIAFDEVRYDLRPCTITGPVTLTDVHILRGYVDLSDATFDQAADFSRARILARVVCERTQFSGGGTFTDPVQELRLVRVDRVPRQL